MGRLLGPRQLGARRRVREAEAPALKVLLRQARLTGVFGPGPGPGLGSEARLRLHGSLLQAQPLREHHACVHHRPLDLARG